MTKEQELIIQRIETLRKERNISLYVLAYRSSVPLTTLTHIVDGTTKNPGVFTLARICDGFEITMREFFDTKEFDELVQEFGEV